MLRCAVYALRLNLIASQREGTRSPTAERFSASYLARHMSNGSVEPFPAECHIGLLYEVVTRSSP